MRVREGKRKKEVALQNSVSDAATLEAKHTGKMFVNVNAREKEK